MRSPYDLILLSRFKLRVYPLPHNCQCRLSGDHPKLFFYNRKPANPVLEFLELFFILHSLYFGF